MKSPPSGAHQTMLAFDCISNIVGGNPPGGPRVKAASRFSFRFPWVPPPVRSDESGVIDIDLAERGKCHIILVILARTKSCDFGGIARFLATELITRKA